MQQLSSDWQFLESLYSRINQECQQQGLNNPQANSKLFQELWFPLGLWLANQCTEAAHPLIQGILGSQGTGKTTLCSMLVLILQALGYSVASLSLDDLYLNPEERQAQFPRTDPRHHYRGAPKTHQIELGIDILQQIKNRQQPVLLPRFDKSAQQGQGRQSQPEMVREIDILLFEGWFIGVAPIDPITFNGLPQPIQSEINLDYARQINQDLHDYQPLWELLDSLIFLHPTDYHFSKQWRQEAEQKMKAQGKSGMGDLKIEQFVNYFWQSLHPELFMPPMLTHPKTDWVIAIHQDHSIGDLTQVHP